MTTPPEYPDPLEGRTGAPYGRKPLGPQPYGDLGWPGVHGPGADPFGPQQFGAVHYGAGQYSDSPYGVQPYGGAQFAVQPYGHASRKEPVLSVFASFFVPGLGSMLNGDNGKGAAIFLTWLVGLVLSLFIIGLPIAFGAWIWGMVDGYSGAQRHNDRHGFR